MTRKQTRIAERGAIVNEPAIDYLTCSTFNGDQYLLVVGMIQELNTEKLESKPKRARGYETERIEWASWGEGQQIAKGEKERREAHFLINVSGKEADAIIQKMIAEPLIERDQWNFSRIDVQLTLERKRDTELGELYLQLRQGELGEYQGRSKPKARVIASETGDTLYIGSPSSQKQIRFYDKPLIAGRKRVDYERFEIQYRDQYANPLATKLWRKAPKYDREIIRQTLRYQWGLLPEGLQGALSFANAFTDTEGEELERMTTDKTESAKLRWLRSLSKTLQEMCSQPGEPGIAAREVLLKALVIGVTGDNLTNWMDFTLVGTEANIYHPLQLSQD